MKKLLIIALLLTPVTAGAVNMKHRKDTGIHERQLQYKCIAEHRDNTWDELRACVKEKKGSSLITVEKFWEKDPSDRKLKIQ